MANEQDKPKIIIDDDWKAQAQAEKEKLAREVDKTAKPAGGAAPGPAGGAVGEHGPLPPASFATLVSTLVSQVLMALGGYEDPRTRRRYVDLDLAKHFIETLAVLEDKTRNNLADDEKKLLDNALYECRMQYVQIAQRVAAM